MHPPEGVPANDHIANNLSTVLTFRPSRDAKGHSWCALVLLLALALMLLSSCSCREGRMRQTRRRYEKRERRGERKANG